MKRTLLILSLALFCLQMPGLAQKARVGITGGATISNMFGETDGFKTDFQTRGGFTTGLIVDAPIGKTRFSFQPGVHYVQKGTTLSETKEQTIYRALRYAEFNLNFLYNTRGAKGINIFFGLGPALALNLPSKTVTQTSDTKTDVNIIFGKEGASELRGVDYGATGLAGLQFKNGAFVSFAYTHGLRNLLPGDGPDNIKNSCFAIRLGILIKNK
jgi:Outer membrane protein beta-barrel domain